jgi:hypothetical protein
MDFNTGQLTFESNFRDKNCISGLNATEVTSYQYLGMTILENQTSYRYDKYLQLDLRHRVHGVHLHPLDKL